MHVQNPRTTFKRSDDGIRLYIRIGHKNAAVPPLRNMMPVGLELINSTPNKDQVVQNKDTSIRVAWDR